MLLQLQALAEREGGAWCMELGEWEDEEPAPHLGSHGSTLPRTERGSLRAPASEYIHPSDRRDPPPREAILPQCVYQPIEKRYQSLTKRKEKVQGSNEQERTREVGGCWRLDFLHIPHFRHLRWQMETIRNKKNGMVLFSSRNRACAFESS